MNPLPQPIHASFGVLANQARLDIMLCLVDGEKCVSDLVDELGLAQTLVSHALKIMETGRFVTVRQEGKFRFYSLNREFAEPFLAAVDPGRFPLSRGSLLRTILAHAPITIAVIDREGRFAFVFGDILRRFGAVEEDFIGRSFRDFYRGRGDVVANIERAFKGEKAHWIGRSGGRVFDTVSMPYTDESGSFAGVVNVSYELPSSATNLPH